MERKRKFSPDDSIRVIKKAKTQSPKSQLQNQNQNQYQSQKQIQSQSQKQQRLRTSQKQNIQNIIESKTYKIFFTKLFNIPIHIEIEFNSNYQIFKVHIFLPSNFPQNTALYAHFNNNKSLIRMGLVIDKMISSKIWILRLSSFYNDIRKNTQNNQSIENYSEDEKHFMRGFARKVLCKVLNFIVHKFDVDTKKSILTLEASGQVKKVQLQQLKREYQNYSFEDLLHLLKNISIFDIDDDDMDEMTKEDLLKYLKALKQNQLLVKFYQKSLNMKRTKPKQKMEFAVDMEAPIQKVISAACKK